LFEWIALAVAAWLASGLPAPPASLLSHRPEAVSFRPGKREVSNWRWEAIGNLDLPWAVITRLAAGHDAAAVTRCVRLNNYWCIKRAGWAGEIAADADGHVAFSSAIEGADVAALLLRRYYLDYGRRSALAIVSHWAPAECGFVSGRRGTGLAQVDHLATHGLRNTLRARFLASRGHRRGPGHAMARLRRSVVPDRVTTLARAPSIAIGMGEREVKLPSLPLSSSTLAALVPTPVASCAGDTQRIRAYATKTAEGVAPTVDADLKLFGPDGAPTANLARVMHNMSAVEIGPLGASEVLIRIAVARAATRVEMGAKAGEP
jgi:hypothetical protein